MKKLAIMFNHFIESKDRYVENFSSTFFLLFQCLIGNLAITRASIFHNFA